MYPSTLSYCCSIVQRAMHLTPGGPPGHQLRIWVAESLGNYRWAVQLGLQLCREYRVLGRGRSRKRGSAAGHATEAVLKWLQEGEFRREMMSNGAKWLWVSRS